MSPVRSKILLRAWLATWLMAAVLVGSAAAGPFEDGSLAYMSGDYATALKIWRPLANRGSSIAQERLGFMYANGLSVAQDHAEAVKWYRKAADQNNAEAQASLGFMYAYGEGVPRDYVQSHMWFSLAATQGDRDADTYRDMIVRVMTHDQIVKAKRMALEWKPK